MEVTRVLLDTSAYSALMRGHSELADASREADEIVMSPVVLGELLAGFRKGRHRADNERGLAAFLASPRVRIVSLTEATAERYATILDHLRKAGTPIPTNDMWIAASAMENGLVLLTTDEDFDRVVQVVARRFPTG